MSPSVPGASCDVDGTSFLPGGNRGTEGLVVDEVKVFHSVV